MCVSIAIYESDAVYGIAETGHHLDVPYCSMPTTVPNRHAECTRLSGSEQMVHGVSVHQHSREALDATGDIVVSVGTL